MRKFPPDLYDRCRECLTAYFKGDFESNKNVKRIISGSDIREYSSLLHDQEDTIARIENMLETFMDKNYGEEKKSVLARFLELLALRYPSQDNHRAELLRIAQEIHIWQRTAISGFHEAQQAPEIEKSKRVLVIRGQNEAAGIEMFAFLNGANLSPMKWSEVEVSMGKKGASIDEIFQTVFDTVQAVIVVFTSDYMAKPKSTSTDRDNAVTGKSLQFHPEPDILFKAGTAFAMEKRRTILVALGNVKIFDPLLERHVIRLADTDEDRRRLHRELERAACEITSNQWMVRGNFNNSSFF